MPGIDFFLLSTVYRNLLMTCLFAYLADAKWR
jgi:hypothetical protein